MKMTETTNKPTGEVDPVDFLRGIAKTVRDYRGAGVSSRVMQMVTSDTMFDRAALELEATRSVAVKNQELLDQSQIQCTQFLQQLVDSHDLLSAAHVELSRVARKCDVAVRERNIWRGRFRVLLSFSVSLAVVLIGLRWWL